MTDCNPESGEFKSLYKRLIDKFDDESFVVEMISIFVVDGAISADRLESAMMLSDATSIRNSLHSLKNILGTMQSGHLFQLVERTSEAFRNGNYAQGSTNATMVISETKRLVFEAGVFLGELQKASNS